MTTQSLFLGCLLCAISLSSAVEPPPSRVAVTCVASEAAGLATYLAGAFYEAERNGMVQIERETDEHAFTALYSGKASLIIINRPLSQEELNTYKEKNGVLPGEHLLAKEAAVIIVNEKNPISELTTDSLALVWGRSNEAPLTWGSLFPSHNDPQIAVTPHSLNQMHGTSRILSRLVPIGGGASRAIQRHQSQDSVIKAVRTEPGAIGVVKMNAPLEGTKVVSVGNPRGPCVTASVESVRSGSYPLVQNITVYFSNNSSPETVKFIEFCKSPSGLKIINDQGYAAP